MAKNTNKYPTNTLGSHLTFSVTHKSILYRKLWAASIWIVYIHYYGICLSYKKSLLKSVQVLSDTDSHGQYRQAKSRGSKCYLVGDNIP